MVWLIAGVYATVELAATYPVAGVYAERILFLRREWPSPVLLVCLLIRQRTAFPSAFVTAAGTKGFACSFASELGLALRLELAALDCLLLVPASTDDGHHF